MKNFFNVYIPIVWGICWVVFITLASVCGVIWSIKTLLQLIGVI